MPYNKIRFIDRKAFEGLFNLKVLDLHRNRLESINGFPGQSLEELDLSHNNISSIDKNAFHGLDKLTLLNLDNNHLVTLEECLFEPFMNKTGLKVNIHGMQLKTSLQLHFCMDGSSLANLKY